MVAKKRKSKRQTLQTKYKIVKRVKEHNKRLKKGSLTIGSKSKKSADNHIPNAWPYKEDLLNEIQNAKAKMEELRLRSKEKRREEIVSSCTFTTVYILNTISSRTTSILLYLRTNVVTAVICLWMRNLAT
jgi:GNL3L/Grn1 putative GTPase